MCLHLSRLLCMSLPHMEHLQIYISTKGKFWHINKCIPSTFFQIEFEKVKNTTSLYGNKQAYQVLRNSHLKWKRSCMFKFVEKDNKWSYQTAVILHKSSYGNKQACKILRNSHLKCRRCGAYKLLWPTAIKGWKQLGIHDTM